MTTGKFYGIGVGPGDPELITLKAIRVLEHCNVIAAPRTRGGGMRALDIAGQAVSLQDKTILPLSFAMSSDRALLREQYQRNAELIRAYLEKGEDTAMICIGDVSVFSTVCQIADVLKEMGCQTCLVPGISSYSAIAARIGISLTEGSRPFHVLPVSDVDLEQALSLEGTKVLMKAACSKKRILCLFLPWLFPAAARMRRLWKGWIRDQTCLLKTITCQRSSYGTASLIPADLPGETE